MFIFIFATVGLLGYAIVRPWVSKWVDVGFVLSPVPNLDLLIHDIYIDCEKTQVYSVADNLMMVSARPGSGE